MIVYAVGGFTSPRPAITIQIRYYLGYHYGLYCILSVTRDGNTIIIIQIQNIIRDSIVLMYY